MKTNSMRLVSKWLLARGGSNLILTVKAISVLLVVPQKTMRALLAISREVLRISKVHGNSFTVSYLKEAHRITIHRVAGQSLTKCEGVPWVSIRGGLPTVIPAFLRGSVRKGDLLATRLVLTILSIYRVLEVPVVPKLETIEAPWSGTSYQTFIGFGVFCADFRALLRGLGITPGTLEAPSLRMILSSGPMSGPSVRSAPIVAAQIFSRGLAGMRAFIYEFIKAGWAREETPWKVTFSAQFLWSYIRFLGFVQRFFLGGNWMGPLANSLEDQSQRLGRLSPKEEAAGKLRVFVIVDYWTQILLYPLHRLIFQILRKIPQDGTFDQDEAVASFVRWMKENNLYAVWSFDLSAATDRIPVQVYQDLLTTFFGMEFAIRWKTLLTFRKWDTSALKDYGVNPKPVTYNVGQPMGAYSSWALLALAHHALVQWAAQRAGWTSWFPSYRILGDDVIIADEIVARYYQRIMEELGIGISMPKSLVSDRGVFEFAKRLVGPHGEYSGISWRLLAQAAMHPTLLPVLVLWLVRRGFRFLPSSAVSFGRILHGNVLSAAVLGPNTRFNRLAAIERATLLQLFGPGSPWYRGKEMLLWVNHLTLGIIDDLLSMDPARFPYVNNTLLFGAAVEDLWKSLRAELNPINWVANIVVFAAGETLKGNQTVVDGIKAILRASIKRPRSLLSFALYRAVIGPFGILLAIRYMQSLLLYFRALGFALNKRFIQTRMTLFQRFAPSLIREKWMTEYRKEMWALSVIGEKASQTLAGLAGLALLRLDARRQKVGVDDALERLGKEFNLLPRPPVILSEMQKARLGTKEVNTRFMKMSRLSKPYLELTTQVGLAPVGSIYYPPLDTVFPSVSRERILRRIRRK